VSGPLTKTKSKMGDREILRFHLLKTVHRPYHFSVKPHQITPKPNRFARKPHRFARKPNRFVGDFLSGDITTDA